MSHDSELGTFPAAPQRARERNGNEVPNEVRRENRPMRLSLNLNVPKVLKERIAEIASDTGISMTAWAIMVLRNAVRNWDAGLDRNRRRKGTERAPTAAQAERESVWPSGWPKDRPCYMCNDLHDPLNEHPTVVQADIDFLKGG